MSNIQSKYTQLLSKFTRWAETQDNIRAASIIGSRARTHLPADDFSDLDLLIIARDPAIYISSPDWIINIGNHWVTFVEPTPFPGVKERRILFEAGLDMDCAFFPVDVVEHFVNNGVPPEVAGLISRGMKIVLDKDGLFRQMDLSAFEPVKYPQPSEAEFTNLVNDFLYHFVWVVKKLGRGEIWMAHSCLNGYLKWRLLTMIEWQARAKKGLDYDTWHDGRFLDTWADPKIVQRLPQIFSRYNAADIRQSLGEILELFRMIALETAEQWGYPYPIESEERIKNWVNDNAG